MQWYDILVVSNDLGELEAGKNDFRSAWFNHLDTTKEARERNTEVLSEFTPDNTIVIMSQLESILDYSMRIDSAYYSLFMHKMRETAPSRKRKTYGLLFDALDLKFLSKPIIHAMLKDRADLVCVPICLDDDLSPYSRYGMKVMIQKVTRHNNP